MVVICHRLNSLIASFHLLVSSVNVLFGLFTCVMNDVNIGDFTRSPNFNLAKQTFSYAVWQLLVALKKLHKSQDRESRGHQRENQRTFFHKILTSFTSLTVGAVCDGLLLSIRLCDPTLMLFSDAV